MREVGFNQPLEFYERLFIKHYMVNASGASTALPDAIANGIDRKIIIVLLARKSFFLCRSDNPAVLNQRRSAVMIEA
jgi:hypothetical protein